MKKRNSALFVLLILSTSFLILLIDMYHTRQEKLSLESNDLYSVNHLFVKDTFANIVEDIFEEIKDLNVFISLESENNDEIRGYFSKDYSRQNFPISEGRFFQEEGTDEALIGRAVEINKINDNDYYIYKDKKYKVIGYLGLISPSFLDHTVILNDTNLFPDLKQFLAVDGKEVHKQNAYAEEDFYQKNVGLNRKIGSDFFSPLLYLLSLLVIVSTSIIASYVRMIDLRKENQLRYILGVPFYSRYFRHVRLLLLISAIPIVISAIFSRGVSSVSGILVLQLCLSLTMLTLFLVKEEKELLHGIIL